MHTRYLHICWGVALAAILLVLESCTQEEVIPQSNSSCIQIIPRVPNFDDYYVSTRSGKTPEENDRKYLAMLVFGDNGKLVELQQSTEKVIVIDRTSLQNKATALGTTLSQASIYLIANVSQAQAEGWVIEDKDDLENLVYRISGTSVSMPSSGLPMVGIKSPIDLRPTGTLTQKTEIPLELLYAKVQFDINFTPLQVNPDDESLTTLYITSCIVHNLPKGVKLVGNVRDDEQSVFYNDVVAGEGIGEGVNIPLTGNRELGNQDALSFYFYMPEHRVAPGIDAYNYPDGILDSEKQRYKPCWVDRSINEDIPEEYDGKPTYVVINGIYTDHQNHKHEVSYKIYLGENAENDFQIKRNGYYVNTVNIKGISKSDAGTEGTVSVDHRVSMDRGEYVVFMERETLLDCHFEVRPIRVKINTDAEGDLLGQVSVSIEDGCDWIRLEKMKNAASTGYCENGKRKYFPDLQTDQVLKTQVDITSNDDNCVWLYIDENVETLNEDAFYAATEDGRTEILKERRKKTRQAIVTITYTSVEGDVTERKYTFAQRYLYPVVSGKRTDANGNPYIYYIECYEEYLHNFDSEDGYGLTEYEGMTWGLYDEETSTGLQISDTYQAAFTDPEKNSAIIAGLNQYGIDMDGIINNSIARLSPQYDFYLTRDKEDKNLTGVTVRDYQGQSFTHEIMEEAIGTDMVSAGTLDVQPLSAAEYCYNKNKRGNNDLLSLGSMKWYLPSIDEMEDIAKEAYFEVPEFQEKFYWSSQPAYEYSDFDVDVQITIFVSFSIGHAYGTFYNDDTNRARATNVKYGATEPTKSGLTDPLGTQKYRYLIGSTTTDNGYENISYNYDIIEEGNKHRTDMCRVRAVYMP